MADSFVIMYDVHFQGSNTSQVAEVCTTLKAAEKWLDDEPKGKVWAKLAKIEGSGLDKRLTTTFGENHWSSYYIRRKNLVS